MFAPSHLSRAAPAKKILAGLTLIVLLGHWLALGGRVDLWPDTWLQTPSEFGALPNAKPTTDAVPALTPPPTTPDLPKPVTVSTVRWIAPPAPEPIAPQPTPAPPKPAKAVKKKVEAPPPPPAVIETPAPEPLPVAVAPPEPEPEPEPEPTVAAAPVEPPPLATATPAATDANAAPGVQSPPSPPLVLAPNATLKYEVTGKAKGFNYSASGTLTWQQNGNDYQAQLEVSAFLLGSYVQTSQGKVSAQGLAPDRFSDKRRSNEKAAHFDRDTGRIRYSSNAPDAPLLPGAQDQLSATLQLASLLNTFPALSDARNVTLPVSSTGTSEMWQFVVGPLNAVRLPAGEIAARLLTRAPRREYDKTVELWLAPGLGFLPVRMRLTEQNGDFLDLLLKDLPPLAPPPQGQGMAVP